MSDFKDDVHKCLEVLRSGGVILYPTDTVWGIGCDATNPEAVDKIFKIKNRIDSKSMIVLLENPNLIASYVEEVPDVAMDLVEYATKPTTVIFEKAKNLAVNVIAEDNSVGIRVTQEKFTSELIRRFRKPIVSTSANISGEPTADRFADISDDIKASVDYVVNYRQDEFKAARASSIIKIGEGGLFKIIRD